MWIITVITWFCLVAFGNYKNPMWYGCLFMIWIPIFWTGLNPIFLYWLVLNWFYIIFAIVTKDKTIYK